jgi:hypothetical protein
MSYVSAFAFYMRAIALGILIALSTWASLTSTTLTTNRSGS